MAQVTIRDGLLTLASRAACLTGRRNRIGHVPGCSEEACHEQSLLPPRSRPMSSHDAANDNEDPEHARFIRMSASETFDGKERVISRAAYDLHVQATAHSANCGHPGFVPDDYLEHLDGLAIETTISAAELYTSGMWERVDGGYRVLDWEAVEVCLDLVRQRRGEDPHALAWEREHEAKVQAHMAKPMVVTPPCAVCGTLATRVELVAPGQLPAEWEQRPGTVQASIVRQTRARTVVSPGQGRRHVQRLRRPHRRQPRRADRLGVPASPVLRPGPHGRVLRRCRILPRLRRSLLLPALARVRIRLRLLPPRPRQEPGLALVAVSNRPGVNQTGDPLDAN